MTLFIHFTVAFYTLILPTVFFYTVVDLGYRVVQDVEKNIYYDKSLDNTTKAAYSKDSIEQIKL
jgi:hypothetical protein